MMMFYGIYVVVYQRQRQMRAFFATRLYTTNAHDDFLLLFCGYIFFCRATQRTSVTFYYYYRVLLQNAMSAVCVHQLTAHFWTETLWGSNYAL